MILLFKHVTQNQDSEIMPQKDVATTQPTIFIAKQQYGQKNSLISKYPK